MEVHPIGIVESARLRAEDDYWGGEEVCIRLSADSGVRSLEGLAEFPHVEVPFTFHQVDPAKIVRRARHLREICAISARSARDDPAWPERNSSSRISMRSTAHRSLISSR